MSNEQLQKITSEAKEDWRCTVYFQFAHAQLEEGERWILHLFDKRISSTLPIATAVMERGMIELCLEIPNGMSFDTWAATLDEFQEMLRGKPAPWLEAVPADET